MSTREHRLHTTNELPDPPQPEVEQEETPVRLRNVGQDAVVDRGIGAAYVRLTPNPPNGLIVTTPADTADWPITINVDFDANGPYGVEILFEGSGK